MDGSFVSSRMVDDLIEVAALSPEDIQAIAMAVESCQGVLRFEELCQLVALIIDQTSAASVARALMNLRVGDTASVIEVVKQWREQSEANKEHFPEELFLQLEKNLPMMIRPFKAIELFKKATHLEGLTGQGATGVELLCDLRPVFDQERETIECMVPLVTLQVSFETEGGFEKSVEFSLTQELLDELKSKVDLAEQKMKVLRSSVEQWLPGGFADLS